MKSWVVNDSISLYFAALAAEPVELLNVQGLRYAEDNDCVVLTDVLGTAVEVIT